MLLRPKPRTFKSFVLRAIVPRAVLFALGAGILALGHAIALTPSANSSAQPPAPTASRPPVWTAADATAYPGCESAADWPAGTPAGFIVVHSFRDDEDRRMAFDLAWRVNHNDTEVDDVWVLGVCGAHG